MLRSPVDQRPKIQRASVVFSPLDPELFNDSKTRRGLHKNCTRRDCRGSESTDERKRGHGKEKERPLKFTPPPPRSLGDDAIFLPWRDAIFSNLGRVNAAKWDD